jgi:hypothetical protein
METETHPDPFQDAMSHGLHRAVQVASCTVTAAQVYVHQKRAQARVIAERDHRTRRALGAQARADRDAARAGWAPVLDPGWLRQADLFQVTRAWGAAMPFADRAVPWYEPAAATAMRKCEERLRVLHPYAMARYDRLRSDGMGPADAMREAAPLFAGPPRAHDTPYAPRQGLGTAVGPPSDVTGRVIQPGTAAGLIGTEQDRATTAERARAAELDAATDVKATPGADERTMNLAGARDAAATAEAAGARASRASRPWERDFPVPIHDVVAAAGSARRAAAPSPAAPARSWQAGRRPGRQP